MLCCEMQRVRDPMFVSAVQPTYCLYAGSNPELRQRCEFRGCAWRRWHMLEGRGYVAKVTLPVDPMLL